MCVIFDIAGMKEHPLKFECFGAQAVLLQEMVDEGDPTNLIGNVGNAK